MITRKTQCGWMALGGTLCLFGAVLVFKMRDGNGAAAQAQAPARAIGAALAVPGQVGTGEALKPVAAPGSFPAISTIPLPANKSAPELPGVDKKQTAEPPMLQPVDFKVPEPVKAAKPAARPDAGLPPLPGAPPAKPTAAGSLLPPPAVPPSNWQVPSALVGVPVEKEKSVHADKLPTAAAPAPLPTPAPSWVTPADMPPKSLVVPASVAPKSPVVPVSLEEIKPLPNLRARLSPVKARLMPLIGTFVGNLEDRKVLSLPASLREQLASESSVLVSPGSDVCLWLTTPGHLDRLVERLERSAARETDVRAFRRLYFAQAEKVRVSSEGRVIFPDRLAQFACLDKEIVVVGVDDHIEIWDAARWRRYTQEKSAAARTAADLE